MAEGGKAGLLALLFVCVVVCVRGASLLQRLEALKQFGPAIYDLDPAYQDLHGYKRIHPVDGGNPCPEAEKPFPCKKTHMCIPMGYLCDDNQDCEDGYDEDPEVCTAAHRPPVEDIQAFVASEKNWIIPKLFGGRPIDLVAHGLAVSPTVDNFSARLSLTSAQTEALRAALDAVRAGDQTALGQLGMPASAWAEVSFIFSKLIKSGFVGHQ